MQNTKVLPLVGLIMVGAAIAVSYAVPRFPTPVARQLPVENFPRALGEWHAGPDMEADKAIFKKIPTAHIVTRNYTNAKGQTLELTLVTATNFGDIHDPRVCFPSQGWQLQNNQKVAIQGRIFEAMTATIEKQSVEVLFNFMSVLDAHQLTSETQRKMHVLRENLFRGMMDRTEGISLLVRVIIPGGAQSRSLGESFLETIMPELAAMLTKDSS